MRLEKADTFVRPAQPTKRRPNIQEHSNKFHGVSPKVLLRVMWTETLHDSEPDVKFRQYLDTLQKHLLVMTSNEPIGIRNKKRDFTFSSKRKKEFALLLKVSKTNSVCLQSLAPYLTKSLTCKIEANFYIINKTNCPSYHSNFAPTSRPNPSTDCHLPAKDRRGFLSNSIARKANRFGSRRISFLRREGTRPRLAAVAKLRRGFAIFQRMT